MAFTFTGYNSLLRTWHDGTVDADTDIIKLALLTSSYNPDLLLHTIFGDVAASELPAANGYAAGGLQLTNTVVNQDAFDADDVIFVNLGSPVNVTFRYGILYVDETKNGIVRPLIGLILFDDTPADVIVSASNYGIQWSAAGIIRYAYIA